MNIKKKSDNIPISNFDWVMIILLGVIWGASFFFARVAVLEIPPLTLTLLRVGIAGLALHVFLLIKKPKNTPSSHSFLPYIIMGLLNCALPFSLLFIGQQYIGAGLASIINAMTPVWTLIFAQIFTSDEGISPSKAIGIGFGFFGVVLMMGDAAFEGANLKLFALCSVLCATISYGVAGVFGKRFKSASPVYSARGQLFGATLFMLPISFIFEQPWGLSFPSQYAIFSFLMLALVCTALAYLIYFKSLAQVGAVNTSIVTLIVPTSAIGLGIIFLNENLNSYQVIGLICISLCILILDGRLFKRLLHGA